MMITDARRRPTSKLPAWLKEKLGFWREEHEALPWLRNNAGVISSEAAIHQKC
jgi:hypothetical protein